MQPKWNENLLLKWNETKKSKLASKDGTLTWYPAACNCAKTWALTIRTSPVFCVWWSSLIVFYDFGFKIFSFDFLKLRVRRFSYGFCFKWFFVINLWTLKEILNSKQMRRKIFIVDLFQTNPGESFCVLGVFHTGKSSCVAFSWTFFNWSCFSSSQWS